MIVQTLLGFFNLLLPIYGVMLSLDYDSSCDTIIVNQPIEYQCILSDLGHSDSVTSAWKINQVSSASPSWNLLTSNYDISIKVFNTHTSVLTIKGHLSLDDSTVECVATGLVNGKPYIKTIGPIHLYVKERIPRVDLIVHTSFPGIINSSWNLPNIKLCYGVVGYEISITDLNKNSVVNQTTEHNVTTLIYNSNGPSYYNVCVAYVTTDNLRSDASFETIEVDDVLYTTSFNLVSYNNEKWKNQLAVKLSIDLAYIVLPLSFTVIFKTPDGNNQKYEFMQITANETLPAKYDIELSNQLNQITNATILITFHKFASTFGKIPIKLFRVKRVEISHTGEGQICFKCIFIEGNYMEGCSVFYESPESKKSGNLIISKSKQEECKNIAESDYNITAYDMELNSKPEDIEPSFITSINVTYSFYNDSIMNTTINTTAGVTVESTKFTATKDNPILFVIVTVGSAVITILMVVIILITGVLIKRSVKHTQNKNQTKVEYMACKQTTCLSMSSQMVINLP